MHLYAAIMPLQSGYFLALQDVTSTDEECPDNHLKMSLVALLCCFPCGIIALYHSMKVTNAQLQPLAGGKERQTI